MKVPSLPTVLAVGAALLALAGLGLAADAYLESRADLIAATNIQPKTASTLRLETPKSGENWRLYQPARGSRKAEWRIEKRDGRIVQIIYDAKGSPSLVNDYCPPAKTLLASAGREKSPAFNSMRDSLSGLRLSRQTEVMGDGFLILNDRIFRPDGSLKARSVTNKNLTMEVTTFSDVNQSVASVEEFNGYTGLINKGIYFAENGTRSSMIYQPSGVQALARQDFFRPDGTLTRQTTWYAPYHTETAIFARDGKTMLHLYNYEYSRIRVTEFEGRSQKPAIERSYATGSKNERIDVSFLDPDKNQITQSWRKATGPASRWAGAVLNGGYWLAGIKQTFPDGHNPKQYEVEFLPDRQTIVSAKYTISDFGFKINIYRPDGSRDRTETYKMVGAFARSQTVMPPGHNDRKEPPLDAALTRSVPLFPVPTGSLATAPVMPRLQTQYRLP